MALEPFRVHRNLNPNVATLRLFPGITTSSVRAFLAAPLQGVGMSVQDWCHTLPKLIYVVITVVLSTYGAGNCPQRKDLLQAFQEASERGLVIVNVTQCQRGMVEGNLCRSLFLFTAVHALTFTPVNLGPFRRKRQEAGSLGRCRGSRYDH